jgi:hypothetical protein
MSHNQLLPGNKKRKSLTSTTTTTTTTRTIHGTEKKLQERTRPKTKTSFGSSCYRRSVLAGNFTKFSEI